MPDHKTILAELKKSRIRLSQMSHASATLKPRLDPIAAKFDHFIPEIERALQLREGYKKAQAVLAPLKKALDEQEKKLDDAKAKHETAYAKRLDAAKEAAKAAEAVWKWTDVMKTNKTLADAVSRFRVVGVPFLASKFEYFDDDSYQKRVEWFTKLRQAMPKPDSSNKLPVDLGILETKLDTLIKLMVDATAAAKAAKVIDHDYNTKKKTFDDMAKKVQPIEDTLQKLMEQIFDDIDETQTLSTDVAYDKTTPEPIKKQFGEIDGDLYQARIDYHEVKVKDFAARP